MCISVTMLVLALSLRVHAMFGSHHSAAIGASGGGGGGNDDRDGRDGKDRDRARDRRPRPELLPYKKLPRRAKEQLTKELVELDGDEGDDDYDDDNKANNEVCVQVFPVDDETPTTTVR